jgi:hypothetical protein
MKSKLATVRTFNSQRLKPASDAKKPANPPNSAHLAERTLLFVRVQNNEIPNSFLIKVHLHHECVGARAV